MIIRGLIKSLGSQTGGLIEEGAKQREVAK